MNQDLISRQAILKHIEKKRQDALMIDDLRESNIIMMGMKLLEEAVRNQPSAQSEHLVKESGNLVKGLVNDCISRKAALQAMDTWDKFGCDPHGKLVRYDDDTHYIPYVKYEDMVNAVKNLPSQPEQTETHSCDYERTETHGWIPVTERLPEEDGCYLVTDDNGEVVRYVFRVNESSREFWYRNVVAWMPQPEPYKEGQE